MYLLSAIKSPMCNVIILANADTSTFPIEIYSMIGKRLLQQIPRAKNKRK
jgi:hypothetical protein